MRTTQKKHGENYNLGKTKRKLRENPEITWGKYMEN
jgi:hypothetical protein